MHANAARRRAPFSWARASALALALLAVLPGALGAQIGAVPGELHVTFLHTSDEHSALLPGPLVEHRPGGGGGAEGAEGGIARLATVVGGYRAMAAGRGEAVLVTSAGDNLGGTPFAWLLLSGLAPELGLMVDMGYDVVTLGNHEFDYDSYRLARYLVAAGYPEAAERTALVATNTRPPPGHPLEAVGLRRTHLMSLDNGLRVGFMGLLGEGAARFATMADPVEFGDAIEAAERAVADLRRAGAQVVVAITHSGVEEDRALAAAVPGIDLILGGHDHLLLPEPETGTGAIIVHPGAYLRQLFVLQLAYDPGTGRVRIRNGETGQPYVVALDGGVEEDPVMAARLEGYRERLEAWLGELSGGRFAALDETVVRSDFPLPRGEPMRESALGNFVTDAMRWSVADATGEPVDFAFQANGVIRGGIRPGRAVDRRGQVTVYDLLGPVGMGAGPDGRPGYPLVSVWLTGEEVRRVMEVSVLLSELFRDSYYLQVAGLRARYDPARAILLRIPFRGTPVPTGRAVLDLEREDAGGWVPLERGDERRYHVVTDRYVASFLPMVGQVVPRMAITPKARDGSTISDLDDAIVERDGEELKVWQAVLEYAAAQPPSADGEPTIDARYADVAGRLVAARSVPVWAGPLALVLLLAAGSAWLAWGRRRRS
jgi:5'-nucleotidase / UDP-sugar diphosphatase